MGWSTPWPGGWEVWNKRGARVGDIQPKTKDQATRARFRLMKCGECSISVEGMEMGWGTLCLRGWEMENEQGTRVGEIKPKNKNRAAGAWFWLVACSGVLSCVGGTYLGWGTVQLRWWGCSIEWRVRWFGAQN